MRCWGSTKPKLLFRRSLQNSTSTSKRLWTCPRPPFQKPWRLEMTITVQIPTALRRLTAGTDRITCSANNLGELFSVLDGQFPDLKPDPRGGAGEIRRFLNVDVNEEDIRFLGGNTYAFRDGDEVLLVPSIAGGAPEAHALEPPKKAKPCPRKS